jgi:hypothetical protein
MRLKDFFFFSLSEISPSHLLSGCDPVLIEGLLSAIRLVKEWMGVHCTSYCYHQPLAFCLQSLRKVGQDSTVLLICITVFLSYLPEAGQYSSFFLYLRQVGYVYCQIYKRTCKMRVRCQPIPLFPLSM